MRTAAFCVLACVAGLGASVGVASGKHGEDDTTGTTTGGTTTDDSTTNRTTTDRTNTDRTSTAPYVGPPRAPLIDDAEADWRRGGKIRLRTELVPRGARVTSVRFRYRGKAFKANKIGAKEWAKTVAARGGDRRGSVIEFRVRACAGKRCIARVRSDEAGG